MDFRQGVAAFGLEKPDAYNPYAAGAKTYGLGRSHPNQGPMTTAAQKMGYRQREMSNQSKRDAYLARMRADQNGSYMSPEWLGGQR